jgi:bifunctional non-homologous end joining protein LigD
MECLPVAKLPEGAEWVYELKLDGYRAQAIRDARGVRLLSRNGKDLTKRFPLVTDALLHAIEIGTAVDGELVALDASGRPSFNALQNASADTPVVFYAFDILIHEGQSVMRWPLRDRISVLDSAFIPTSHAKLCDNFPGPAKAFTTAVRKLGGEGVVAKRLDRAYEPGKRSGAWVKMRLNIGQEFVIGGYTPGSSGFDSVIVGYYRPAPPLTAAARAALPPSRRQYVVQPPQLVYVARVRAGFVPASRRTLFPELERRRIASCPFVNLPQKGAGRWGQGLTAEKMRECVWVKPELVAQFEFVEWTAADHVRHIKFIGLREDKNPLAVSREET